MNSLRLFVEIVSPGAPWWNCSAKSLVWLLRGPLAISFGVWLEIFSDPGGPISMVGILPNYRREFTFLVHFLPSHEQEGSGVLEED